MNGVGGYARVYRGVFGHPAFRHCGEEAAFIWMVAKAAWQPARVRYKGRVIHLKRGQLALSTRDFGLGFGWSKGTIWRFLDRLKTEAMIGTDAGAGVTIITICNYDIYQAVIQEGGAPVGALVGAQPGHKRGTEQRKEERKKEDSHSPAARGKGFLPKDWKPPGVEDLTPEARTCARQWPPEIYAREAEGFALYWRSERKMKTDWRATWANRIIQRHWAVMQETRRAAGRAGEREAPLYERLNEGRR